MKKRYTAIISLLLCLFILVSCSEFDKIKSTEDELRVVGTIKDEKIYYDELRCSVMNAKTLMASTYGIDWSDPQTVQDYGEELERRVLTGLKYNYAVQLLFRDSGYELDNYTIQTAVQSRIEELIVECGNRRKYKKYLKENFMTDRVLRFNIAVSYAVNELIYSLNDQNAFSEYGVDFDIESITYGDAMFNVTDFNSAMDWLLGGNVLIRSEHIYIPETLDGAEQIANSLYEQAQSGGELTAIAEGCEGIVREELTQVQGERDESYYSATNALEMNALTLIHTDAGWYIIRRLEPEPSYAYSYCFDLVYKFVSIKTNEHIAEYENTLEIELTEFGKSLDFTAMN